MLLFFRTLWSSKPKSYASTSTLVTMWRW